MKEGRRNGTGFLKRNFIFIIPNMYKYQISKKKQIFNIFVYLKVTKTRAINTFFKSVIQEHPSRHKGPGIDTYCLGTDICCPGINIIV